MDNLKFSFYPRINLVLPSEMLNVDSLSSVLIEFVGRTSTDSHSKMRGDYSKFVRGRVKDKHFSLGRSFLLTFLLEHSLVTEKQLLRHKHTDWCIKSLRYTNQFAEFLVPPSYRTEKLQFYKNSCHTHYMNYKESLSMGISKEDARYLLPMSCMTKSSLLINLQAARDLIELRLMEKSQDEIKLLTTMLGLILLKYLPDFFFDLEGLIVASSEQFPKEAFGNCLDIIQI